MNAMTADLEQNSV